MKAVSTNNNSPTAPAAASGGANAANGPSNPPGTSNGTPAPAASGGAPNTTIGHYIIGKQLKQSSCYTGKALGKGTFGQVKQATHILTGEKVIKLILIDLGCSKDSREGEDQRQEGRGENYKRDQDSQKGQAS